MYIIQYTFLRKMNEFRALGVNKCIRMDPFMFTASNPKFKLSIKFQIWAPSTIDSSAGSD